MKSEINAFVKYSLLFSSDGAAIRLPNLKADFDINACNDLTLDDLYTYLPHVVAVEICLLTYSFRDFLHFIFRIFLKPEICDEMFGKFTAVTSPVERVSFISLLLSINSSHI